MNAYAVAVVVVQSVNQSVTRVDVEKVDVMPGIEEDGAAEGFADAIGIDMSMFISIPMVSLAVRSSWRKV